LFHGGFGWASGGYLGVSVFFTLSGFLITRLLLDEHGRTGGVDLRRFYGRRIRRLLPASALTLVATIALARLGAFEGVADLRRDVTGAALQLGNWAQLTSGRSYADLFAGGASPVEHFWSLAIEEQFYLVWPVAFLALARGGTARRLARRAGVLFVVAALAAPLISRVWGAEAAYLSTPARLAELLAGVVLAAVTHGRRLPPWWRWAAVVAIAAFAVLVVVTPTGDGWAYAGGLPAFACLTVALLAGLQVDGPVRRVLSWRPLVLLGAVSYGVYLVHWPIFLLLDAHPLELDRAPLFALKVALTLAVAVGSYALVERPIRASRPPWSRTLGLAVAVTAVVAVAALVVVPAGSPSFADVAGSEVEAVRIPPDADPGPYLNPRGGPQRPLRIVVAGDSTGEVVGGGLVAWANRHRGVAQVQRLALAGCGLVTGGRLTELPDAGREACDRRLREDLPEAYRALRPDVVVISIAAADTWDRSWDGGEALRPTDPAYADRIRRDYDAFFAEAVRAGVPHVVWLRPPEIGTEPRYADPSYLDGSQALVERTVRSAVERHPGTVSVLDLRSWFEGTPHASDPEARPDGVHLVPRVRDEVVETWLGPELLAVARRG
ncbi:MAG TPA: acyltransferase family protein, partial [Aquihabitans sp.]|nr:acyltransferase family protein [Aquihabitans sp.]